MQGNQLRTKTVIRFGAFEVDLHTQELRKHGIPLRLRGQIFSSFTDALGAGRRPRYTGRTARGTVADTHIC
jgi:hypothetical protein